MRGPRKRSVGKPSYHHLYNRVGGEKDWMPFGDAEKMRFIKLLKRLQIFFTTEVIAYCIMSNHFHFVGFDPGELPSVEDAVRRYNDFYPNRMPIDKHDLRLPKIRKRQADFSMFMKDLQQLFTDEFNKNYPGGRRGHLWQERFKNTILEGGTAHDSAAWTCIKYVELNPVRAGITADPADYRFSSWGEFQQSGKHPLEENFFKHARFLLGEEGAAMTDVHIERRLRSEFARTVAAERGGNSEEIYEAAAQAAKDPAAVDLLRRGVRAWVTGEIVGLAEFVSSTAIDLLGTARVGRKRFGNIGSDEMLRSYRRPRKPPG